MKILQIMPYFWPALSFGGPVKVVYDLSREMSKKNFVEVYTSDTWDQTRRIRSAERIASTKKFKVKYFRNIINFIALKWRIFTNFGMIKEYLEHKDDFDVIHVNDVFSLPQIILVEIARMYKKTYVVSPHGVDILNRKRMKFLKIIIFKLFLQRILKNAKTIIATSEGEAKILRKYKFKNVKVVFNGVSKQIVDPSSKFKKYRNKKVLSILYIGRITFMKGLDELIDAAAHLQIPFQILIAGPDQGLKNKLMNKIRKCHLRDNIHFLGFVNESEKLELFQMSDLFVYPSESEGFSISILEAMSNGLPVLITEGCNFPDVAKFKSGVVIPLTDMPKRLTKKIEFFYTEKKIRLSMGKNAKELIRKKYSIQVMTSNVEKIYREFI